MNGRRPHTHILELSYFSLAQEFFWYFFWLSGELAHSKNSYKHPAFLPVPKRLRCRSEKCFFGPRYFKCVILANIRTTMVIFVFFFIHWNKLASLLDRWLTDERRSENSISPTSRKLPKLTVERDRQRRAVPLRWKSMKINKINFIKVSHTTDVRECVYTY